jgi:hypothetical protein
VAGALLDRDWSPTQLYLLVAVSFVLAGLAVSRLRLEKSRVDADADAPLTAH